MSYQNPTEADLQELKDFYARLSKNLSGGVGPEHVRWDKPKFFDLLEEGSPVDDEERLQLLQQKLLDAAELAREHEVAPPDVNGLQSRAEDET